MLVLFAVFIVVVMVLRAGAAQAPDGVARRHQPRKPVLSHDENEAPQLYTNNNPRARIISSRATSRIIATIRNQKTPHHAVPTDPRSLAHKGKGIGQGLSTS